MGCGREHMHHSALSYKTLKQVYFNGKRTLTMGVNMSVGYEETKLKNG